MKKIPQDFWRKVLMGIALLFVEVLKLVDDSKEE